MFWVGRFRLADPGVSAMAGRRTDPRRNKTGNSTNAIGRAPSPRLDDSWFASSRGREKEVAWYFFPG